jgi:uncharacterized protein YdaU (DUF1376 family)
MTAARPDTWMPLYWGDYLRDTMHLSTTEHGAYLLLIAHYWTKGEPLPDDDFRLSRIARMTAREWRAARPVLEEFFAVGDGLWHHKRIEHERRKAETYMENKARAGKEGARQRWQRDGGANGNRHGKVDGSRTAAPVSNGMATGQQNDAPSPSPSPSPVGGGGKLISERIREHPDRIEAVLRGALGAEDDPNPMLGDISPVIALIDAGISLEGIILPKIRAMVSNGRGASLRRKVRPWAYLTKAISDDLAEDARRVQGVQPSKLPGLHPQINDEAFLAKSLAFARKRRIWTRSEMGPMPNEPGCLIPQHLLELGDGEGWVDTDDDRRRTA